MVKCGCGSNALFGPPNGSVSTCSKHKTPGYINLRCPQCITRRCGSQAYFGTLHQKPKHCGEHRRRGERNVVMKECADTKCHTRATCGEEGGKPTHCRKHCSSSAILRVIKLCSGDNCDRARLFGKVGGRAEHCSHHREKDEIDVVSFRCETSGCSIFEIHERPISHHLSSDGIRMCSGCYRSLYPELNKLRVRVEHFVLADIQRVIPHMTKYLEVQDCPIPCGVSMERPDALYVTKNGKTLVHIEIDETPNHENDTNRLMRILASTDAVEHIVVRVHTHQTVDDPSMFVSRRLTNGEKVLSARPCEFSRRMKIIEKTIKRLMRKNRSCIEVLFA